MIARKRDVAEAIMGLGYIEMQEMAEMLVSSVKSDADEQLKFDPLDVDQWCSRLRWWAEGYIDAEESAQ